MTLTASNLAHHLIARGLISAASVVDGDLTVLDAGRRNSNFKVLRTSSPGLFVKQARTAALEAITTHNREAAFYHAVRSRPALEPLARIIPKLVDYYPQAHTLVVELIPGAENLTEYHWRTGRWPESIGGLIGRSLGLYHACAAAFVNDTSLLALFPRQLPFVLNIDPVTLAPLPWASTAGTAIAGALRENADVLTHLQQLRSEWQLDALIHGDMKLDNCVIFEDGSGQAQFRVVDWELADIGDASWDCGSIFATCLAHWVFTSPMQPGQPAAGAATPGDAAARLAAMQPMLRAFWGSYVATRGLAAPSAQAYLRRCLRFCAARLVLSIVEYTQGATQLTPNAHSALQLCRTIFAAPEQAAIEVLGAGV